MATLTFPTEARFLRDNSIESAGGVTMQLGADTIRATVRVRADTRRVYQALVSPEYVETWLAIPDAEGPLIVTQAVPSQLDTLPAWECSVQNDAPLRIHAGFTVARRRRLFIRWKLDRGASQLESRISIRLIGDFEHTTLALCHAGIDANGELGWHHQMWRQSLCRLAKLYQNEVHAR
ncbi:MAG: SRPBCC domain-containing protein [Acidobacteriota bacterium]|nr:SRPBCC domain-containing protein [Acidobacteriota bacterium]